jgi:hypothetical protein
LNIAIRITGCNAKAMSICAAPDTWNRIVSGEYSKEEQDMKIQALKDYCHLDTLAMVEIWKVLNTNK